MQDIKDILPSEEENKIQESENKTSESEDKTSDEKVEVPQSVLEQLRKEIDDLKIKIKKQEVAIGDDVIDDEEDKKQVSRMRVYDDKYVIGFNKKKGSWLEYDEKRREDRLMQEIILMDEDGKEYTLIVDYIRFNEDAKTIEVPIQKIDKEEVVQKKGLIRVREVIDYKTVMKKDKVMQKVVSSKDTATVTLPNGKELELDIEFINL